MGQSNTREIVLLQSTTAAASAAGVDINIPQAYQAAIIVLNVSAASGTSPTLNVVVQSKIGQPAAADVTGGFPTGTAIYDDFLAFGQATGTATRIARVVTSGPAAGTPATSGSLAVGQDYAQADGTLTAGNYRIGPMGGMWRVKYTIAGTSPSFTFSVTAHMVPYST